MHHHRERVRQVGQVDAVPAEQLGRGGVALVELSVETRSLMFGDSLTMPVDKRNWAVVLLHGQYDGAMSGRDLAGCGLAS